MHKNTTDIGQGEAQATGARTAADEAATAQPGPRAEWAARAERLQAELEAQTERLRYIEQSTLWRATRPFALLLNRMPRLRRLLRGVALRLLDAAPPAPGAASGPGQAVDSLRDADLVSDGIKGIVPLFCLPAASRAAAVPFGHAAQCEPGNPEVAVICHLHYAELGPQIRAYLTHLPFDYDLLLSTDSAAKQAALQECFATVLAPAGRLRRLEVKVVPNRGRDIAPKLLAWRDDYARYEYVLHIHGKRSLKSGRRMAHWRDFLLRSLIGSPLVVRSIFEAFRRDPGLGMVAPDHFREVLPVIGWGTNFPQGQRLAARMRLTLREDGPLDFPSGSMFWARSSALRPLLEAGLRLEEFEAEAGQRDGTLAHAIERLYFFSCECAGLAWMKVAPGGELDRPPGSLLEIADAQALEDFLRLHRVGLTVDAGAGTRGQPPSKDNIPPGTEIRVRAAWQLSGLRDMGFAKFARELEKLRRHQPSAIDFDEAFYCLANPDVGGEVAAGRMHSGYSHFCLEGRAQGLPWSDNALHEHFALLPALGSGLIAPARIAPLERTRPELTGLPLAREPFLLILLSHLQEDLFFAGYSALFAELAPSFGRYARIVAAVEHGEPEPRLAQRYDARIEVLRLDALGELSESPHVIVCMNERLTVHAIELFGGNERVVYFCQDYEAGFAPYSTEYVRAQRAVRGTRWLAVSTQPLADFLRAEGLLPTEGSLHAEGSLHTEGSLHVEDSSQAKGPPHGQRLCVTAPRIGTVEVTPERHRRLFFYFRPERFNSRNLSEIVIDAVRRFCAHHSGYELYLMGTVGTHYSYTLNGNRVFVLSKLPPARYREILAGCDCAVALIYSAHPGVIAYEAAASGIPTVTNVFGRRDAAWLKSASGNLVPFDPVTEDLLDKVEEALGRPKGVPSFNAAVYTGPPGQNLTDFLEEVRLGR